jgi:serine/threonine protein phosphatase PrpC
MSDYANTAVCSLVGNPPKNQDSYLVIERNFMESRPNNLQFYLVADGHGPCGSEMSAFIKEQYPPILRKNLEGFYRDDLVLRQEKSLAQSRESQNLVGAWDSSQ